MAVEELDDGRKRLTPPMDDADVDALHAGDVVVVKGSVYAARDAAHKRMMEMLDAGESLPFDPVGAVLYYVGPTPERPGNVIGSAGPTTASRMDKYTDRLLDLGVKGLIGKGGRGRWCASNSRTITPCTWPRSAAEERSPRSRSGRNTSSRSRSSDRRRSV
jgi:tartrate dehydratase beta subunit/fumarate hydratase class I family protein